MIQMLDRFTRSYNKKQIKALFLKLSGYIASTEVRRYGLSVCNEETHFELGINLCTPDNAPFKMVVTGCQGEGTKGQRDVAAAMNENIQQKDTGRKFGLLLGDNFYDSGVDTPSDPKFYELFQQMYTQKYFWFAALGNHDWNFQNAIKTWLGKSASHHQKAMAQVDHTYYGRDRINKIDTWLMPHRYYIVETNWANFIVLDSNTLCFDKTQQAWFKQILTDTKAKTPHRKNIVAMHHPLISVGKRYPGSDVNDVGQYLLPEYNYRGPRDTSLNNLLLRHFDALKEELGSQCSIDLLLCAHDHFLAESYLPGLDCKQLTLGGGGGHLQNVQLAKMTEFSKKTYGFAALDCNRAGIDYTFYDAASTPLHNGTIGSRLLMLPTVQPGMIPPHYTRVR